MQLNIEIPNGTPSGAVLVAIQVGNSWSVNNITVALQ
jgi:hypothetical protein